MLPSTLTAPTRPTSAAPPAADDVVSGAVVASGAVGSGAVGSGADLGVVLPLASLDADVTVSLADGRVVPYANLDLAASAPCVAAASNAVTSLLPWYASVHRGAGALSQHCTEAYEHARRDVADFLGGRPGDTVVFTRNTTDALNLLAHAVPAGTPVICFDGEHHANLLPWRDSVRLPLPASPAEAVAAVDAALRRLSRQTPPGRCPALVSVTGASNVTGERWPVRQIVEVAHRYGARVALDAAQLAPHLPVDVTVLDVDYVAVSGHKLYAPFGAGVLVGRADWLDEAEPYLRGGGASAQVADRGPAAWVRGPGRHEAGTPNLLGAVALAAVCRALSSADRTALHDREQRLLARLTAGLADIPGVTQLSLFGPGHPRVGIVAFTVAGVDSATVARRLNDEHGVGVRAGLFCAHPLTRHLLAAADASTSPATTCDDPTGDDSTGDDPTGTVVRAAGSAGAPGTAVRASIGLPTTGAHIDRLIAGVAAIARG